MHCTQCGTALSEGARFCGSCGASTSHAVADSQREPTSTPGRAGSSVAFWIIGAAVGILIIFAVLGNVSRTVGSTVPNSSLDSSSSGVSSAGDASAESTTISQRSCISALDHASQAMKDYDADDYEGGYKNANTAVSLADSCPQGGDQDSAKGFALSARALNEHHLSYGDSRTDLNQAEQLLASCQSDVGYYGTHSAALCETLEQNDISTETNWEMNE